LSSLLNPPKPELVALGTSITIATCNKCGEYKELVLAGCVCATCSDRLDSQWASISASDWVLITTPGPNDKAHSALVALKESLGLARGDADRQAEAAPFQYIYRNSTYAQMKSHWATADPSDECRLTQATPVEVTPLNPGWERKENVRQAPMLRPATCEEIAEHDLRLRCRQRDEETVAILEKWGFNDEYAPLDGVWDANAEDRAERANEEIRQRLAELGLIEGSGYEKPKEAGSQKIA
jgi:hypothetical protein